MDQQPEKDDRQRAVDIIASRVVYNAANDAGAEAWEDYPKITLDNWNAVDAEVYNLLSVIYPSDHEVEWAQGILSEDKS